MSKFRIEFDASFESEDNAVAFLNLVQGIKDRMFKGTGNEEIGIITKCRYHECYHDEIPPKQCGDYINYDLKKEKVEVVKTKAGKEIKPDTLITKGEVIA